ncbi:hypothetical protein EON67_10100 [archaeon]|nr:MAG: hypothetical protein EON67_10100 [archaeon]
MAAPRAMGEGEGEAGGAPAGSALTSRDACYAAREAFYACAGECRPRHVTARMRARVGANALHAHA